MPDGTHVQFPDDMPREQIASMIKQKFPEQTNPSTWYGRAAKGVGQGVAGTLLDAADLLPDLNPWGREERAKGRESLRRYADQPSDAPKYSVNAQDVGKFIGGGIATAPLGGPAGELGGMAMEGVGKKLIGPAIHAVSHGLTHKLLPFLPMRIKTWLGNAAAQAAITHPAVQSAINAPASGVGRTLGQLAGQAAAGTAGGVRQEQRGGDNGGTGAPRPPGPAPAPTGGGTPRSAGKPGVRDNNPPADQRSNRRWSNLDYFRDSKEEQGP
jgi:hypothetical protein